MLDPQDFIVRNGGDPEKIRASQRARNAPVEVVDEVIALFESHRSAKYEAMQLKTRINEIQQKIQARFKAKEDAAELVAQKAALADEKQALDNRAAAEHLALLAKIKTVGNYVHESVPVSADEADNQVIRTWKPDADLPRDAGKAQKLLSHHQVLTRLGGYDPDRAIKLVGHRGYCLTGYGVFLYVVVVDVVVVVDRIKLTSTQEPSPHQLRARVPSRQGLLAQSAALFHEGQHDGQDGAAVRV